MAAEPELIIKFKGDTKDLDAQLAKLKSSLGELEPATNKATNANKKLEDSNNNLGKTVGKLAAGYLTLQAALSAGKFILDATLQVSKFETQLQTASGSQAKFGSNMQFLEDIANTYKKNVVDLGSSFAQLTIATRDTNLEGAETEKLFKAVTIASSALKMSADDTTGTFRAFIQMVSKGKVQAEELRGQLGERLYGAFNLFAQGAKKSTEELNGMLERGELLTSDVLPKVTDLLIGTFSDDAIKGAQTLGSNIDYASGQLTLFVAELAKTTGLESAVNTLVSSFGSMLSTLRSLNKESGIVNGFFDRMFTLPGNKLTTKGSDNFDTFDERINKLSAGLNKGIGKTPFSNTQSTTSTQDYGKQFNIRDINPALEDKLRKQNEAAANRRNAELNRIYAEENRVAKQLLEDKLAKSESDINAAYLQYNGVIQNSISQLGKEGLKNIYDSSSFDKIGEEFTKSVTGDGETVQQWSDLADSTKNGMDKFVQEVKTGGKNYKGAIDDIAKSDAIDQLSVGINNALSQAATDMSFALGEMIGSALAGGDGFENAGKKFGLMIAGMLQDIGKALIAFATLKIAASKVFSNPYVALAVGIAAVAAGAYLKTKLNGAEGQGLYTGGFVQGRAGTDNIPTRLTAGELVLNKRQQSNMFGLINGTNTGRNFNQNFATSGANADITGQLVGKLRGSDIDIAARLGAKTNNKFRGR